MQAEIDQELFDESAERCLLSGLMINTDALGETLQGQEDFFFSKHRHVFEAIQILTNKNIPIDLVSLNAELKQAGHLEEVGGAAWVAELSWEMPSAAAVKHHAEIVKEFSRLRNLQNMAKQILQQIENQMPSGKIIEDIEQTITMSGNVELEPAWRPIETCVQETLDDMEKAFRGEGATGMATGLTVLERKIGGLRPGSLIVLAGRPGMGKTSLGLLVALTAAKAGKKVGILSLEMSSPELVKRLLAMQESGLSVMGLEQGKLSEDAWRSIVRASEKVASQKIFVCDEASVTIEQLRTKARGLQRKHGLDILIVDYLQLFEVSRKTENRVVGMTEVSRALKVLAKELAIPVVALSQVNRQCESRQDKRPLLSDLRETGAIEQDADVVIMIYRDEVYDHESPDSGIAELLIRKNRHGPTGDVRVGWDGARAAFSDLPTLSRMK